MTSRWLKAVLIGLALFGVAASKAVAQEAPTVALSAADMTFVILITAIVIGGMVLIAWLQGRRRAE